MYDKAYIQNLIKQNQLNYERYSIRYGSQHNFRIKVKRIIKKVVTTDDYIVNSDLYLVEYIDYRTMNMKATASIREILSCIESGTLYVEGLYKILSVITK